MTRKRPRFGLFSNVKAVAQPGGKFVLAGRLLSGMDAHIRFFDCEPYCICEPESEISQNQDRLLGGDNVEVNPKDLPFELIVMPFDSPEARRVLADLDVVIAGIGYQATHLARWGRELGTTVVYGTEYTLATRLQVIQVSEQNPLVRLRRMMWEHKLEKIQRRAIQLAAGVQCNGTPTFDDYRQVNPNTMLFFDGRIKESMLVTAEDQRRRADRLRRKEPLRLAWSGRLNAMKGANHLSQIARRLRELSVPFQLEVFGGGVCEPEIRRDIHRWGLEGHVHVHGFVDFHEKLTPYLQKEVDIWVCPHVQGDPSGAYIESFGDGLPIVGYGNEALAGMLKRVDAGCIVAIGDSNAVAARLTALHDDREQLVSWSTNARAFAEQHTFDRSFQRRMEHLSAVMAIEGICRQ